MQQSSQGRHKAGQSRQTRDAHRAADRATPRIAAAWCRWFAVFGLVALIGIVLAYRGKTPHAEPTAFNGSTVPLLGSSVLSLPNLAADTADFGRMPIVRVYYPGLPDPNAWTTGLAGANHSAVIVSFKALPTTILSGADDSALRHFFDSAPSGHPIYYTYYHEPEDNIAAGQFKLADYKAAWARVVAIADAAHKPELHSTLILMSWDLVRASHRNWKDYLPGGKIISTLGWDAYPVGSATNVHPQLTPASGFMGPAASAKMSNSSTRTGAQIAVHAAESGAGPAAVAMARAPPNAMPRKPNPIGTPASANSAGSRPLTGSSNSSTGGSPSSADAMPRRWAMPRENLPARRAAALVSPTMPRTSSTLATGILLLAASAARWARAERPGWKALASSSAPTSRSGQPSSP